MKILRVKSTGEYRVVPNCCEETRIGMSVFLYSHIIWPNPNNDVDLRSEPKWVIANPDAEVNGGISPIKFCPFCGQNLPKIVPSNIKQKICEPDGEGYCLTCKERVRCCECLPTMFKWKSEIE